MGETVNFSIFICLREWCVLFCDEDEFRTIIRWWCGRRNLKFFERDCIETNVILKKGFLSHLSFNFPLDIWINQEKVSIALKFNVKIKLN